MSIKFHDSPFVVTLVFGVSACGHPLGWPFDASTVVAAVIVSVTAVVVCFLVRLVHFQVGRKGGRIVILVATMLLRLVHHHAAVEEDWRLALACPFHACILSFDVRDRAQLRVSAISSLFGPQLWASGSRLFLRSGTAD